MEVQTKYDWQLYWTSIFEELYIELLEDAERASLKFPDDFHKKPAWKLLEAVDSHTTNLIPQDPNSFDYGLGTTLGAGRKNWRRVKKHFPSRYRLFFQFSTSPVKCIVYAYFNNRQEGIIRRAGHKKDIYIHFGKLLDSSAIPNKWSDLLSSANPTELDLEDGDAEEQRGA
jgi:hypothetical protein